MNSKANSAAKQLGAPQFELGKLVITLNALRTVNQLEVLSAVRRHQHGDWGDLEPEDIAANVAALQHGGRLLSAYTSAKGITFWVVTEANRRFTTVLLPEDY